MNVPIQETSLNSREMRGPRARTRRLMLDTAVRLMQAGITPSVTDVAEAAGVSRATAYRYFTSQAALVHAAVDEGLGPILEWQSASTDTEERVADLLASSMPRIAKFEATFKAALKLSLDQWARRQAGTLGPEPRFKRGHRVEILQQAIAPLRDKLSEQEFLRLAKALSLVYGLELVIVLRDIWGLGKAETEEIAQWAARALIRTAIADAGASQNASEPVAAKSRRRASKTTPHTE
ncbi:MAG: TetR/AcrR family transcriptional regulator [Hyphomicrobiales bacterium]|nr:TetR/AcrR family transcriptional regulator [Hyphomicrobiales bacterium]